MMFKQLSIALTALICYTGSADAAGLYRWVDEQGNVHYSDRVPPEQTEGGRAVYNEGGIRIKEVAPAMTEEEKAREAELARLREQQQKLIDEQRGADERLLRSFPTEEDIYLARDGKLATVDLGIDIAYANIQRMKHRLLDLQEEVEFRKSRNQPVDAYQPRIDSLSEQIEDAYSSVLADEQRKEEIRSEYDHHAERYRELKQLAAAGDPTAMDARNIEQLLDTVMSCEEGLHCARLWHRALEYAKGHALTPVALLSESLFMTAAPVKSEDISITLSMIPRTDTAAGYWIFLDLQCAPNALGNETCFGPAAEQIRSGFKPAVTGDAPLGG